MKKSNFLVSITYLLCKIYEIVLDFPGSISSGRHSLVELYFSNDNISIIFICFVFSSRTTSCCTM